MTKVTLDAVELGEATVGEARSAVAEVLQDRSRHSAERVYAAFRAWVWKALNERRRDAELRQWVDLMKRAEAFLESVDPASASRIAVLHELVRESITVSEALPLDRLIGKRHVKDILLALASASDGRMHRAVLREKFGLKEGNLSRVLNMMTSAGLLDRKAYGKQAVFELTREGSAAAAGLAPPASFEGVRLRVAPVQTGQRGATAGLQEYVLVPVGQRHADPTDSDKRKDNRARPAIQAFRRYIAQRAALRQTGEKRLALDLTAPLVKYHPSPNRSKAGSMRDSAFHGFMQGMKQQPAAARHDG